MPPFNVISRRSTPEIVLSRKILFFQNSKARWQTELYCQLSLLTYVITGKLLATHFYFFLSLKYGVTRNDKKAMMKGRLGWIRGMKGQEQDMSSLALEPFF